MSWILHVSDLHLGDVSPGQTLTDQKYIFPDQPDLETTQKVLKRTLARLRSYVETHDPPDAVVVSGDLTYRARDDGFDAFKQLLTDYAELWPDRSRIVVVPGNHDVVWNELPGKPQRYAGFLAATRIEGCVTPLIDGVDFNIDTGRLRSAALNSKHVLEHPDFLIIPINSSNFCGLFLDLADGWTRQQWETALKPLGDRRSDALEQLDRLRQHDIARVSQHQFEALGELFTKLKLSKGSNGLTRIAVIHHQLLPVSTREERKSFEALSNLGLVRQMLREYDVDVVLHGHKHEGALFWDFLREEGEVLSGPQRRVLVAASPGHFEVGDPVMRAFHFEGNPRARNLRVVKFRGPTTSSGPSLAETEQIAPIWLTAMEAREPERCFIRGGSPGVAYARLRAFFEAHGLSETRSLVCQIDDPAGANHLPPDYPPLPDNIDSDAWIRDLVDWWQLDWSLLLHKQVLLFNHGERIYARYGNQIERAISLLNKKRSSSRAIVVLVHPRETGYHKGDTMDQGLFPAFALAEFVPVDRGAGRELDCFGYFRKQEIQYWWSINVAELARLQATVAVGLTRKTKPGRLVTFSGIAEWKTELPRVAVPELDRLVDTPGRLPAMAAAIVFPEEATPEALSDWNRVLVDLRGLGRAAPPIPRLGHHELEGEILRLQRASGTTKGGAVLRRFQKLGQGYDVVKGQDDLNAAAIAMITDDLKALTASVRRVLS